MPGSGTRSVPRRNDGRSPGPCPHDSAGDDHSYAVDIDECGGAKIGGIACSHQTGPHPVYASGLTGKSFAFMYALIIRPVGFCVINHRGSSLPSAA